MARLTVRRKAPFLADLVLEPLSAEIEVGDVLAFAAVGVDQNGDPFPVSGGIWTSSDLGVAGIDPSGGTATGLGEGEADITYTVNGQTFA